MLRHRRRLIRNARRNVADRRVPGARCPGSPSRSAGTLACRFNAELRAATDWTARRRARPFHPAGHGRIRPRPGAGPGRMVAAVHRHGPARLARASVGQPGHASSSCGFLLEPMIGIGWFAAIYFTGGFAGALLSMLLNPPAMLSVGASGAIMATWRRCSRCRFHTGAKRPRLMRRVAGVLAVSRAGAQRQPGARHRHQCASGRRAGGCGDRLRHAGRVARGRSNPARPQPGRLVAGALGGA